MSEVIIDKKPLLSIVTPVYNREDTIARCIESVLAQDFIDYEFIIIDDGSSDETIEIILRYLPNEKLKFVRLPENRGVNFARNRGIETANGEFIAFLDSDDYFVIGAFDCVANSIIGRVDCKHFLFDITYNADNCMNKFHSEGKFHTYNNWLSGQVNGDFLHVVRSDILKEHHFHEDLTSYEHVNWCRIFKKTEPQYHISIPLVIVEPMRGDSLSRKYILNNMASVLSEYNANIKFLNLYFDDLAENNINCIKLQIKTLLLGVIAGTYEQNKILIARSFGKYSLVFSIINNPLCKKVLWLGLTGKAFLRKHK